MTRPLHILTHEFYPQHGGIATYTHETAAAAARAGYDVTVHAPDAPALRDWSPPYRIALLPVSGTQGWMDRFRLAQAIRSAPIDWDDAILYLPEPAPIRLWMYAGLFRLPRAAHIVVTLHGSEVNRLSRPPHRKWAARRLFNRCQHVGLVSRAMLEHFEKRFPRVGASKALVPGGVRGFIREAAQTIEKEPHRTSDDGSLFRLLTVARIHPRKGQLEVVEALGTLPESVRGRIVYELVGPVRRPKYLEQVRRRATALGVALEETGPVPDEVLVARYRAADAFVMASKRAGASVEGLGLSLLEAQAMGVPVIATRTGGTSEAVNRGKCGLLVPVDKPTALADAIQSLVSHPERRQQLAARAREWVLDAFSWDRNVEKLFGGI